MTEANAWSRGYPTSETYPSSWHSFQSPAHLRAICALMGVQWEVDAATPLSVAEVGCANGYTACVLAAGLPQGQVLGLDYNPAHIAEARSMAREASLDNLRFIEADLAEIGDDELDRLPEFDLVTVHGMWSWVADPVREGILRLLRRRLKPGGLAMVSYNALPGAAGALGLWRLVRQSMLQAKDSDEGVARAGSLVQKLMAAEASNLPVTGWRRILSGETKGARPGYLMHEFQTEHWRPCFHADVAAAMGSARCDYVGSATVDENFPQMSLTPAQQALYDEAGDAPARELIFDLCVQRAFRRDLYVRGLRRVPRDEAVSALWMARAKLDDAEVALNTQAGRAELPPSLVRSVRQALAERPQRIGELRQLPGCSGATPAELLAMLVGTRIALPLWRAPSGDDWEASVAPARRLNRVAAARLAPHGMGGGQLALATPALAGGLIASPLELAVSQLLAADAGRDAAARFRRYSSAELVERLLPAGASPPEQVLAELNAEIGSMLDRQRPLWQALGIV